MADWDMTLTINSVAYDLAAQIAGQIFIDSFSWDLDDDGAIEFHELCSATSLAPRWNGSHLATLDVEISGSPVRVAGGQITDRSQLFDANGEGAGFAYRVSGWAYVGNQLPVVAIDGTNAMMFNLSPLDDDYLASEAGLTVGAIIAEVLTRHATALTAAGITTDATTTAQLAALVLVPPEATVVNGSRLLQATDSVLRRWARNVVQYVTGSGVLRYLDTTAGTALTLTYGSDPIEYPTFDRSWTDCNTAVQVVGKGKVYPAYCSLLRTTLTASWTSANQSAWTSLDYSQPMGAFDAGTVSTVLGPTSVRVQSDDATAAWITNFWSGNKAWIYLEKSLGTGLTYQEARPVTACTALSAGGASDLTLGFDLENTGAAAFDKYTLIGDTAALASGGLNAVWRLFDVTDPGGLIADHLVKQFPVPVPFMGYGGGAVIQTNFPQALVVKSGVSLPMTFSVLPRTGQILFHQPICAAYTSAADMAMGGSTVQAPDDLYVLLAYSRGALTARAPVSGYSGTGYTVDGLQRVHTIPIDSWVYAGNQDQMAQLAAMHLASMQDSIVTGQVAFLGLCPDVLAPLVQLSIAATTATTGYESLAVPVRGARYDLHDDGRTVARTRIRVSSRRNPRTGDRAYVHPAAPAQAGIKFDFEGLPDIEAGAGKPLAIDSGPLPSAAPPPTAAPPGAAFAAIFTPDDMPRLGPGG